MKLTANITLDELCKSQVSERKGINNNPNPQQIENMMHNKVNIQFLQKQMEKALTDIEVIKDKVRANGDHK